MRKEIDISCITLLESVEERETADGSTIKIDLKKMCGDVDRLRWFRIKRSGNDINDAVCVCFCACVSIQSFKILIQFTDINENFVRTFCHLRSSQQFLISHNSQ
jgi:hypothetical protein